MESLPHDYQPLRYARVRAERRVIALADVQDPIVRRAMEIWRALAGARPFPGWPDIDPRRFRTILKNLAFLRVIGACDDYQLRIVGDTHIEVLGVAGTPKLLSELDNMLPGYPATLKPFYDRVVAERRPLAIRSALRNPGESAETFLSESVFLPIGPDDENVDHVMIASVFDNRGRPPANA